MRQAAASTGDPGWLAVAAVIGGPGDVSQLRAALPRVAPGVRSAITVAHAAEAALIHGDAVLAEWAIPRLARLGPNVVMLGFGTVVLAPAPLYLGMAHGALGDWGSAGQSFRARGDDRRNRPAPLWYAAARPVPGPGAGRAGRSRRR